MLASLMAAQSQYGELRLSVMDEAGAALPAHVELRNAASKLLQGIDLPETGHYIFKALPPGRYRLIVEHRGFAPASDVVEIRPGLPQTKHVELRVAAMESRIDVNDSSTLVEPDRTGSEYQIGRQELGERSAAAAPGRGLIELIAMQPGWTLEANGILHPRDSEYDTQFVLNGIPLYDNRSPAFAPTMDPDGIESVNTITGGIPAEFGEKLGGVVEVNTRRNTSPGFHGTAVAQGGSFSTGGGFLSGQLVAGRTTASATAQGFVTDRYLDPPTTANDSNHASNTSFTGALERDINEADRFRVWAARRETHFLVPNDFLQQAAGQRQDRSSGDTEGVASFQHVFGAAMVGALRGMVRDVNARLWSNPLAIPIAASQDRGYREGYVNGSISGQWNRHEWKAGAEARWAQVREQFGYQILTYQINGVPVFDDNLPARYDFRGHGFEREQAAYAQDTYRWRNLTLNAGMRFDHYGLLVQETGWSPRVSVAWALSNSGTVLHAAYDRTFGTPPFENLLVSADASAKLGVGLYLPVRPSRGNYYEAGLSQVLGTHLRLDATWFVRDVRNFLDDDVLLNTGVSFPITNSKAHIYGAEVKVSVPDWGPWSGYVSYSNSTGTAYLPISGGLFLDEGATDLLHSTGRFPLTQDQRNVAHAFIRYQMGRRAWTAWSGSYTSGLPVEGELPDENFLAQEYGADVLRRVNLSRGRVRPSFNLSASVGFSLWERETRKLSVQGDVMNLTGRLNLINFAGLLSGTAIAEPRSAGVRLRWEF